MKNGTNGAVKSFREKFLWEAIRIIVVVVIALGGAYWGLLRHQESDQQKVEKIHDLINTRQASQCASITSMRINQETVLITLLTMVDTLNDRQKAGLAPMPPEIRRNLLLAIARLPDNFPCEFNNTGGK